MAPRGFREGPIIPRGVELKSNVPVWRNSQANSVNLIGQLRTEGGIELCLLARFDFGSNFPVD